MSKTLLLAVSAHGLGHLGQTVPLLNALQNYNPELTIKLYTSLPQSSVRDSVPAGVELVAAPEHVTVAMQGPLRVDLEETRQRFIRWHQCYEQHCQTYRDAIEELAPDIVISNIDYTPLSAAYDAGVPAFAMCSLNWADIIRPMIGRDTQMLALCDEITAAYRKARHFFRISPGMPMPDLDNLVCVDPLARRGTPFLLRDMLGLPANTQMVMFSLGGIEHKLDMAHWKLPQNTHCIVPDNVETTSPQLTRLAETGLSYIDALASVDVLVTKPGYGNFCESWNNRTAIVYVRRDVWPEEAVLIDWLHQHSPAVELSQADFASGNLCNALAILASKPVEFVSSATGEQQIVRLLAPYL